MTSNIKVVIGQTWTTARCQSIATIIDVNYTNKQAKIRYYLMDHSPSIDHYCSMSLNDNGDGTPLYKDFWVHLPNPQPCDLCKKYCKQRCLNH